MSMVKFFLSFVLFVSFVTTGLNAQSFNYSLEQLKVDIKNATKDSNGRLQGMSDYINKVLDSENLQTEIRKYKGAYPIKPVAIIDGNDTKIIGINFASGLGKDSFAIELSMNRACAQALISQFYEESITKPLLEKQPGLICTTSLKYTIPRVTDYVNNTYKLGSGVYRAIVKEDSNGNVVSVKIKNKNKKDSWNMGFSDDENRFFIFVCQATLNDLIEYNPNLNVTIQCK